LRQIIMLAIRETHISPLTCPQIKDLQMGLWRLSLLEAPKQAVPLDLHQVTSAIHQLVQEGQRESAALFALAWVLAGRLGEVSKIPLQHVTFVNEGMQVKFTIMKGVFGNQLKVVPLSPFTQVVQDWIRHRRQQSPKATRAFSITVSAAITQLRRAANDQRLTGHSFRRGALQHADRQHTTAQDMQALSGHKTEHHLQRYLGRATQERQARMTRTGLALIQSPSAEAGIPRL
jgi:integrase